VWRRKAPVSGGGYEALYRDRRRLPSLEAVVGE